MICLVLLPLGLNCIALLQNGGLNCLDMNKMRFHKFLAQLTNRIQLTLVMPK